MRLGDLLGAEVRDVDGRTVGRVRDVRLVQDGPLQGAFGAALRVDALVVGTAGVASRLGYGTGARRGPWIVRRAATSFARRRALARWDDVDRVEGGVVTLSCVVDDLDPEPTS